MIDTVVLVLNEGFSIMEPDNFQPSTRLLTEGSGYMGSRGFLTCKLNPTPAELRAGNYSARLSLTKRFTNGGNFGLSLKIELSLPKLLYGNNFDELVDSDLETVIDKLYKKLKEKGVYILHSVLASSLVSSIHYSKNIILTDGRLPKYWLDTLAEANISKQLDTNKDAYRNEGHLFKTHSKTYEVAFYDKIRDLEQATKSSDRAYENDNEIQLGLFDSLSNRKRFFEVLRFEVRLNTRQKIQSILKKLDISEQPSLANLFRSEYALKVLLYYLDEIRTKRPALLDFKNWTTKKFLSQLVVTSPEMKPATLLKIAGMKAMTDEMGLREARQLLFRYSDKSWYKFVSEMNNIHYPDRVDPLLELRQKLVTYKPVFMVDYEQYLINNDKYAIN